MAIITISRGTFSGGKMLAECLSRTLGFRSIDRDTLVRKAATPRVTEYDLRAALEEPPAYPGRLNHKRYVYLALIQAALLEEVRGGKVIYHGMAGHLLLRGAPGLVRLRIIAPLEARIRMAQERLTLSRDDAAAHISRLDHSRRKWTQFLYGLNWEDPALYDLVINLERLSIEQACRLVLSTIEDGSFELKPEGRAILDDLALASCVRRELALNPLTLNLELEVESRGGDITVRGDSVGDDAESIQRVACGVPGVSGCQVIDSTQAARSSASWETLS